jgi:ABC-type cobalamin/Fe3+-siderophores transport system ATPase subunit
MSDNNLDSKSLILPPREPNTQPEVLELEVDQPVVIIGANGAGKSRFGFWIEKNQLNPEKVHRISAQKSLDFPEYVRLTGLEQAEKELLLGTSHNPEAWGGVLETKLVHRWPMSQRSKLSVTVGLDDYEKALALLFARKADRDDQVVKLIKQMQSEGKNELPQLLHSPHETLLSIWNDILPHRKLFIDKNKINVLVPDNNDVYQAREMSDGERVALYLMAQCLCVPSDSIIIIDEPEMHLHKSLMSKLWSRIEEVQSGCLFVYITHDLDFVASRLGAKKLWLKSYDGNNWKWQEVPKEESLPEPVLLEILGNRKKTIFIESQKGSLDYKIYEAIYPEFLILPRGSCKKVIEATKAMQDNPTLKKHIEAFGIIDRDYRTENEISSLIQKKIFTLDVAEIENILCVPELLQIVAVEERLENPSDICKQAVDLVMKKLEENLPLQVAKRSASEIQFKLNSFNEKKSVHKTSLVDTFNELVASIDVEKIYNDNLKLYEETIFSKDYKNALRLYNQKNLHTMIAPLFDLHPKGGYLKKILRLLSSERKNEIVSVLKQYTPAI